MRIQSLEKMLEIRHQNGRDINAEDGETASGCGLMASLASTSYHISRYIDEHCDNSGPTVTTVTLVLYRDAPVPTAYFPHVSCHDIFYFHCDNPAPDAVPLAPAKSILPR